MGKIFRAIESFTSSIEEMLVIKSSSISMVPNEASSPVPSFSPPPASPGILNRSLPQRHVGREGFILTNNGQSLFPLFEHFDGTSSKAFETLDPGGAACLPTRPTMSGPWVSWKIVPSPSPANSNTRVDILFGETVIPQGNLWLVANEFGRTPVLNATGQ
jgi:hypothetical protein